MNARHPEPPFEPTQRELRRLVALVHDTLPDGAALSAEDDLSPAALSAVAANRRVTRALGAGGPTVSPAMRERVEAMAAAASRRATLRARLKALATWRPTVRARVALVTGAVALALGLALSAPQLLRGAPSVDEVVALGPLPAERPAPAPARGEQPLLAMSVDGVSFPDWSVLGWIPYGSRSDEINGRAAETVFYVHEGHRVAYTILAGDAIDPPADARPVSADGTRLAAFESGGQDVVVFQRGSQTCVLSGHVLHASSLVKLATWDRGDGIIEF